MRAPTTQNATRNTSTTSGGWISYVTIGKLIVVSFTLNITTTSRNTILGSGLPLGTGNAFSAAVGANNRCVPVHVDSTNGNLVLSEAAPAAAWYNGLSVYASAN